MRGLAGIILLVVAVGVFATYARRARAVHRGTVSAGRMSLRVPKAAPKASGAGTVALPKISIGGAFGEHRREIRMLWHKTHATNWLEEQRETRKTAREAAVAAAKAGATAPPKPADPAVAASGGPASQPQQQAPEVSTITDAPKRRKVIPGFLVRKTDTRTVPASQNGETPQSTAPGSAASDRPAAGDRPQPQPPAPPQAQPAPAPAQTGGTAMTNGSTGAVEQVIEGIHGIHGSASAGNIHAKHRAIKACAEASVRFGQMAVMLARALAEPGSNYGPEITEPLAKAGTHLQAVAMAFGESDAALSSLKGMTVGDLANSPRQAPDKSELTETGS